MVNHFSAIQILLRALADDERLQQDGGKCCSHCTSNTLPCLNAKKGYS